MTDTTLFQVQRPKLLALAYRMLGDLARAEDIVQDAWLRWSNRRAEVEAPGAYLATIVTRLCLTELDSARARREESRGDRLPEPIDLRATPLVRFESLDDVSMAFLVLLQRLSPVERAVLLLHDVFEFAHAEVSRVVGKNGAACRQILHRARAHVRDARRTLETTPDEHRRMLAAFLLAAGDGDVGALTRLLADDVVLIADAGVTGGSFGGVRNIGRPLVGRTKVAAFVAGITPRGAPGLELRECELNGQPAALALRERRPFAAILIAGAEQRIRSIFIQADPARLARLAAAPAAAAAEPSAGS